VLASFRPVGRGKPDPELAALVKAALRRRSDRRPFAAREVEEKEQESLRSSSGDADVWLDFPDKPERHAELAVAVSWADRVERNDEAYLAEMRHWLRDPEVHTLNDGVPVEAIPHVPAEVPRHTDVPLRDFEIGVTGRQLIERDVDEHPLIVVIFSASDAPQDHLRSGIAMMRLMLQADLDGLSTCPLSQAVDFAAFRTRLQGSMGWVGYPQMMLRLGYPSSPVDELPMTPRRDAAAVLDVG
jgi:hypothetical protein